MPIKVIITGATGMVGEGVLLTCLTHPEVVEVLSVSRRFSGITHPKLKECIVSDFLQLDSIKSKLAGYDACFYCAGVSSVGMSEEAYAQVTYTTAIHFAATVQQLNPGMVFTHVSGALTDGSEKGNVMWARVKGRTENALMRLPFKAVYNFRPGLMSPAKGQKHIKTYHKIFLAFKPVVRLLFPKQLLTLEQVAHAMVNAVTKGFEKHVLEIADIRTLSSR